jgi:hypothetical protein
MNTVYIVIDCGEPYPVAYTSFADALVKVKEKYKETLEEELIELNGGNSCSDLDAPENTLTGITYLYVEKGIHIYIYKLPIISF